MKQRLSVMIVVVTIETLPMEGQVQRLTNHVTDYGPGDPGYRDERRPRDKTPEGMKRLREFIHLHSASFG